MLKNYSLLLLLPIFVLANSNLDIEDDFLRSLDDASKLATSTKLNVDKTTSLVTTLQGKELRTLGVNSVYDALEFIPGIELRKEASGVKSVIFRGSVTKGEVKFMVDGTEINNAYRASFYYYLDFPIELVSRIEVLRGSDSVLYGSGAISGVINIVTKSSQSTQNGVFLTSGSNSYAKGGAFANISKQSYQLSFDAYYQQDDKFIDSTDQSFKDYSFGLNFKAYNFELITRLKKSTQGNSYGVFNDKDKNQFTPDTDKERYNNDNISIFSTLKHTSNLSKNNKLNLWLNYSEYSQEVDALFSDNTTNLASDYKESSYYAKLELTNTSVKGNKLLAGTKLKHAHTKKTDLKGLPNVSNIVSANLERDIYSVYLKNNYLLTQKTNLELGVRYDDYSDFGDNISPHFGFVYRLNEQSTFKLKHAEAFRSPSWTELYGLRGDPDLVAETSSSTEFRAIYTHNSYNRISLNLYNSKIQNYIKIDQNNNYSQDSELNLKGVELDLMHTPLHNLELNFIASYTEPQNKNGNTVDEITRFLTTTSLIYRSNYDLIFGSTLRYKNTKEMENEPILNQSVTYAYKAFDIELVVKNLFDSEMIYYDANHDKSNPIKDAQREVLLNVSWVY